MKSIIKAVALLVTVLLNFGVCEFIPDKDGAVNQNTKEEDYNLGKNSHGTVCAKNPYIQAYIADDIPRCYTLSFKKIGSVESYSFDIEEYKSNYVIYQGKKMIYEECHLIGFSYDAKRKKFDVCNGYTKYWSQSSTHRGNYLDNTYIIVDDSEFIANDVLVKTYPPKK